MSKMYSTSVVVAFGRHLKPDKLVGVVKVLSNKPQVLHAKPFDEDCEKSNRVKYKNYPQNYLDWKAVDARKLLPFTQRYGVYDIGRNDEGWVSIGINHDTAQFATRLVP